MSHEYCHFNSHSFQSCDYMLKARKLARPSESPEFRLLASGINN